MVRGETARRNRESAPPPEWDPSKGPKPTQRLQVGGDPPTAGQILCIHPVEARIRLMRHGPQPIRSANPDFMPLAKHKGGSTGTGQNPTRESLCVSGETHQQTKGERYTALLRRAAVARTRNRGQLAMDAALPVKG